MPTTKHITHLALLIVILSATITASAQKKHKTTIFVEHANYSEYNEKIGKNIQKLIGDIVLRHDSTFFYCDSAYLNDKTQNFDGFGHIHINSSDSLHIYGDSIQYNSQSTICVINGNVVLHNDSTKIESNEMDYNRTTKIANYPHEGIITRGNKVLTSRKGTYDSDNDKIYFYNDVVVTTPDCKMLTDTLFYFTKLETMMFFGPTTIINKENTIKGEYGRYNTISKDAVVNKKAFLQNESQSIAADSLFYNQNDDFAKAHGNVVIIDTSNKLIANCQYGEMWKKLGYTFITDSLMLTYYEDTDSLFLSSDSLRLTFDTTTDNLQTIEAINNVKFFRTDVQGRGELLIYSKLDSTMHLLNDPVVWFDSCQLTAVSIRLTTNNNKPDSAFLNGKGFIIMHDSIEGFNQIKGDTIIAKLIENKLDNIRSTRNAEMIFYVREDDGTLTGLNKAKAPTIAFKARDGKIQSVVYKGKSEETMFPEKEISTSNNRLGGFVWLNNKRPHSKDDVWTIKIKQVENETIVEQSTIEEPLPTKKEIKRRRR